MEKEIKDERNEVCYSDSSDEENTKRQPSSAYMIFSREIRSELKKDNPGATFKEIGILTAKRWASLKDKDRYEELAKEDQRRWKKENKEDETSSTKEVDDEDSDSEIEEYKYTLVGSDVSGWSCVEAIDDEYDESFGPIISDMHEAKHFLGWWCTKHNHDRSNMRKYFEEWCEKYFDEDDDFTGDVDEWDYEKYGINTDYLEEDDIIEDDEESDKEENE